MNQGRKIGHEVSLETRKKISQSLIGNKRHLGSTHSKETKQKMSEAKLGKKHTAEHNQKISLGLIGNKSNTGRKLSEVHKKRIGTANSGDKAYQWKDGISKDKTYKLSYTRLHRIRKNKAQGSHTLQQWNDLKKKYKYTCPRCKKKEPEIKLTRDHIEALTKGGTDFIENIQPLCTPCNSKKYNKTIKYGI